MAGFEAIRVRNDLRDFVVKNFLFGVGAERLTDDGSLLEAGVLDSTGVLELVAHIEEKFAVKINDDELVPENLDSLANLVAFIGRKLAAGTPRT
jgi:acyl carrier protein